MIKILNSPENRILFAAIAFSIAFHLFWISAINIVSKPSRTGPVKFSKISFLGPISEKGSFELKAAPKAVSFLEKRYRRKIVEELKLDIKSSGTSYGQAEGGRAEDYVDNSTMTRFIEEALGTSKQEPANFAGVQ